MDATNKGGEMKKALLVVSILFIVSNVLYSQVHSGFYSGNELLAMLEKPITEDTQGFADQMLAKGYIMGVFDAYDGVLFRSPSKITVGQVKDIGKKYLKDNPKTRHEPAYALLVRAFREAFPMKDSKK